MKVLRTGVKLTGNRKLLIGAPPATWQGHMPGGMTQLSDHPFTTKDNSPSSPLWDTFGADGVGGTLTLESDATAPKSPSSVIRATYPTGFTANGDTPGFIGLDFGGSGLKKLYFCYWVKYSSNFFGHSTQINKINYCWVSEGGGFTPFVMESEGAGTDDLKPHVILQNMVGPGDGHYFNTLSPGNVFVRDQWHLVEGLLTGNTAGNADGRFDIWVNGLASIVGTGLQWTTGLTEWLVFEFQPIWGGSDPTGPGVPSTMYIQWDHCHLRTAA